MIYRIRNRVQRRELRKLCRDIVRPDFTLVELGCFYGDSTVEFSRHAAKVYAIDSWEDAYLQSPDVVNNPDRLENSMAEVEHVFDKAVASHPRIAKIKAPHEQARPQFSDASVDVVYIDLEHSEEATGQAIDLWLPVLRAGGFMAGHDYVDLFPGVIAAVEARKGDLRLWGDGNWAWQV